MVVLLSMVCVLTDTVDGIDPITALPGSKPGAQLVIPLYSGESTGPCLWLLIPCNSNSDQVSQLSVSRSSMHDSSGLRGMAGDKVKRCIAFVSAFSLTICLVFFVRGWASAIVVLLDS